MLYIYINVVVFIIIDIKFIYKRGVNLYLKNQIDLYFVFYFQVDNVVEAKIAPDKSSRLIYR